MIQTSIFILIFFIPLLICPFLYDGFSLPKFIFLKIVVVSLFFIQLFQNRLFKNFFTTKLDVAVFLFVVSSFLSTVFSTNPYLSFSGMYLYYFEGLQAILCYWLIYLSVKNNVENQEKLIRVMIISTGSVSFYGLVQYFGLDPVKWASGFGNDVWSTFGNPNFLGAFLSVNIPIVWYYTKPKAAKILITGICTFVLIFTNSLAAFIAFTASIIAYLLASKLVNIRYWILSILISIFLFLISPLKIEIEPGYKARLISYKVAVEMFKEKPIFGQGLDTFDVHFRKHMPSEYEKLTKKGAHPGYAHSQIFQKLATTGLIGLLIYLFLIYCVLKKSISQPALFSSCAAFFIQELFGFSSLATSVYFFAGLGMISRKESEKND